VREKLALKVLLNAPKRHKNRLKSYGIRRMQEKVHPPPF